MVALLTTDDDLPEVDPASIEVTLSKDADEALWQCRGFACVLAEKLPAAAAEGQFAIPLAESLEEAQAYYAAASTFRFAARLSPGIMNEHTISLYYYANYISSSNRDNTTVFPVLNGHSSSSSGFSKWGTFSGYDSVISVQHGAAESFKFRKQFINLDTFGFNDQLTGTPNYANMFIYFEVDGDGVMRRMSGLEAGGVRYHSTKGSAGEAVSGASSSNWGTLYLTGIDGVYDIAYENVGTHTNLLSYVSGRNEIVLKDPDPVDGHEFVGWTGDNGEVPEKSVVIPKDAEGNKTYRANWTTTISFDTSSEPGDEDYPGVEKPDQEIGVDDGLTVIEDPKRPGYVFEGWAIPNGDGTEAVDQDLVYQGDDGKWYVDASKLPDYADANGKVELTARWTSVISVDVPSSVTFYADLVTQGQESREGAAEGAFGQSKVANQSQVDLRVVGLESSAVKTTDTTLGADSILKKADAATPSTSTQKLLSLYPSTKQWTADELKDPDAVGGSKATTAVDFDLDDVLLEKSFKADDFTIAAGGTLNMGYRLNLSETGQQLDYDKLSTLSEGQSASIANVSYTFAGDVFLGPTPSGDETDPLYVTVDEAFISANGLSGKAATGTYGLSDIKAAAEDIASKVTVQPPAAGATADQVAAYWDTVQQQASQSDYYPLYKTLLDKQVMNNGKPIDPSAPYFQLKVDGYYLPVQLVGICQDTKSDGTGNAGLTFQMRDIYAYNNMRSTAAGGGTFTSHINSSNTSAGGWDSSAMRSTLRSTFWGNLSTDVQKAIVEVDKCQQLYIGPTFSSSPTYLQRTTNETIWLPSMYEVFGVSLTGYNESEALTTVAGYAPFQYIAYQGNEESAINGRGIKAYNIKSQSIWWFRSACQKNISYFCSINSTGGGGHGYPSSAFGAVPCFCL